MSIVSEKLYKLSYGFATLVCMGSYTTLIALVTVHI